ncbi:porin [Cupriavidus numazuensis]|uniref:Outer membrane porin protein n=1 Tax=Cupriavidus numazuensis TaxID=221992 RepID=A0ABM8TWH3_9BURK|nr:porin [Cupriavidus numazuensis]CAG2161128.1 Outer membrane porin protein [Cupriavidus numazuensis]
MKHKLCAVAVLGAMSAWNGAAHAANNVTLYGVIDAPIEYVNRVATSAASPNTGGSRISMPSVGGLSASRWGMRGTEDLGSGLQATFVLEGAFMPDTGAMPSSGLFGRIATVGLKKNDLGQITFGRQTTSLLDGLVNFSPLRFAATYEPGIWWMGVNYRESNMAKYTGQFGNVQAVAHYSFGTGVPALSSGNLLANGGAGEDPAHGKDNTAYGASVMYLDGTFGLGIGYDQWNPALTPGQTAKVRKASIGGSYANGPFKLTAGYRWNKADFPNGNTFLRDDYWWAGLNYQVTPALGLSLAYFYADVKKSAATPTAASTNPPNMQQYTFLADYNLSKRTDVYFSVGYAHNGSLSFDSAATAYAFSYPSMAGQKNMVGVITGIRHIF